jgi:hypothetical protein
MKIAAACYGLAPGVVASINMIAGAMSLLIIAMIPEI